MKKFILSLIVALLAMSAESDARIVFSTKAVYSSPGCSPSTGCCLIIGSATVRPGTMMADVAYNGVNLTLTMSKTLDISPADYIQYFNQGPTGILNPGGILSFDPNALLSIGWFGATEFEGQFVYTEEGDVITIVVQ